MSHRVLRLPEVTKKTGLARTTLYRKVQEKEFPHPIDLGGGRVGWIESEIDEWIEARMTARPAVTQSLAPA